MLIVRLRGWLVFGIACGWWAPSSQAAPPRYDHVIIVIEENHSNSEVFGNPSTAPYLTHLAAEGVGFNAMRAITHGSQPNYFKFYSGSNQGIAYDTPPVGTPYSTPHLGSALRDAGLAFMGYAESVPVIGDHADYTIWETPDLLYERRHVPWTAWIDPAVPTPPNRLPPSVFQPFSAFPTDFATLPAVAIVIPNQQHNMHDGSITLADNWLLANLGSYVEWAKTHNSLLIVTCDEDDFTAINRIPTVFAGAHLRSGQNSGCWTLHNILRTVEDIFGLPKLGNTADVQPITGVFEGEAPVAFRSFRQGDSAYGSAHDTMITAASPTAPAGAATVLRVDASPVEQALVRFENLFGNAAGQVPPGAGIVSAKLILTTTDSTVGPVEAHPLLVPWSETSVWNDFGAGLQTDGLETAVAAESKAVPNSASVTTSFDATVAVRSWAAGAPNYGWAMLATNADAWNFVSSENATAVSRPTLEVTFALAEIQFGATAYAVNEDAGTAIVTVTRGGSASGAVSVNYATVNGSATAGGDYTATAGTLNWADGDMTPRSISTPIVMDSTLEGDETLQVTLSNSSVLAVLGSRTTATVTLVESPYVQWRVAKFGSQAATALAEPAANPDGDALVNLLEYAFAGDPLAPIPPSQPQLVVAGGYLAIGFPRVSGATDLTYTVQVSSDLEHWLDGSTYSVTGDVPINANTTEISHSTGVIEQIVVRDNTPLSNATQRFLRLQIQRR